MPNIKSAMKRVKVSQKANLRNRSIKSNLKTTMKKYDAAVAENTDEAAKSLPAVNATLDKAVSKGVIHKNTANRRKANAAKKLNRASNA